MADEETNQEVSEVPEVTEEVQQQAEAPKLSAKEIEAQEIGWRPKDQWTGDPEDWVDARTFLRNGEFMGKIHNLNRQNKDLHTAVHDMKAMLASAEKKGREAAIAELKASKVQALQHGDYEKVTDIDERIAEAKADAKEAKAEAPNDPYVTYAQEVWFEGNKWFAEDAELREEFETVIRGKIGADVAKGKATDPEEAFKYATTRIKKMYPEKFQKPKEAQQSVASASGTTRPAGKKGPTWGDLTEDQAKIGNNFVRQGIFTKAEYLEQLRIEGVI
jgi:hypothetical protein